MTENQESAEEKIKRILRDPKLSSIKAMLEKDHAIDFLLLLYLNRGRMKEMKDFMDKNKLTFSDGTYRARMLEQEQVGVAESRRIDPRSKRYRKTELRDKVGRLLLGFFDGIAV